MKKFFENKTIVSLIAVLIIAAGIGGYFILKNINSTVYTDQAQISAPSVNLISKGGGILQDVFASEGDI